mgnify:CR=1 FL=1
MCPFTQGWAWHGSRALLLAAATFPSNPLMSVKFAPVYGASTGPPPAIGSAGEDVGPVWNNGACIFGGGWVDVGGGGNRDGYGDWGMGLGLGGGSLSALLAPAESCSSPMVTLLLSTQEWQLTSEGTSHLSSFPRSP